MTRLVCLVIFLAAVLVNSQPDLETFPDILQEDNQIITLISPEEEPPADNASEVQDSNLSFETDLNQSSDSSSSESEDSDESDEAIFVEAQSGSDETSNCARKIKYESCQLNVKGMVRNFWLFNCMSYHH